MLIRLGQGAIDGKVDTAESLLTLNAKLVCQSICIGRLFGKVALCD